MTRSNQRINTAQRRAEADRAIAQLQHLMDRPPRPSDTPLNASVQLSSCPHFDNCLYLMAFSNRERLSCHLCPVFDFALGRALSEALGTVSEDNPIPEEDALEAYRPETASIKDYGGG